MEREKEKEFEWHSTKLIMEMFVCFVIEQQDGFICNEQNKKKEPFTKK